MYVTEREDLTCSKNNVIPTSKFHENSTGSTITRLNCTSLEIRGLQLYHKLFLTYVKKESWEEYDPKGVHEKNVIPGGVHGKNVNYVIPARSLIALDFSL